MTADTTPVVREFVVRMRHDGGHVNVTVHGHQRAVTAVRTVLDIERAPLRSVVWVKVRPVCDYCTEPGTRYVRDSGNETPLCAGHARKHYGTVRAAHQATGLLGIRRFAVVPADEWKDQQAA